MASVALNVATGLRPWRQAGITHLLLNAPLAGALCAAARPLPAPALTKNAPLSRSVAAVAGKEKNGRSLFSRPAPCDPAQRDPAASIWPDAWQALWTQVSVPGSRPAAVWTYAELGADLRGRADAGRRQVLQTLLGALRLPKGSHAFWPYCLPPDNAPEPEMFLAGLTRFRPWLVLLAGGRAVADLAGLGLPSVNFQLAACGGFRFILLPDLAEVAEMTAPRREQLVAFVRAAIR